MSVLRGLVSAAVLATTACTSGGDSIAAPLAPPPTSADPTELDVSPKLITVQTGQSQTFSATAKTATGTTVPMTVTWSATSGTVDANGEWTAPATAGTAKVIVRQQGGSLADTASVTVSAAAPVLTGISVSPGAVTVAAGATHQFSAVGILSGGGSQSVAVTWSASSGSINTAGLYTAPATAGSYRVIAKQQSGTFADTATVTVSSAPPTATLTGVTLTPASVSVQTGGTQQFSASGRYSDGSTGGVTVTYSATGGTVTTGGLYTAGGTAGTFRIIATAQGAAFADTSAITVSAPAPTISAIEMTPATASLLGGATRQFTTIARMSDGSAQSVSVNYTTNGGTVTTGGLYTAPGTAGTYRVIATQQGATRADTSTVTVTLAVPVLTQLTLTPPSVSVAAGATQAFGVTALWSDGGTTLPGITYSATGGTITTGGVYTAGSTAGTFRVIAKYAAGILADTSTVTVTVTAPTLTAIAVTPTPVSVQANSSQQMTATGTYSNGTTGAASVTWSATGGSVSSGGMYTAGATTGSFRVIATSGALADTSAVTITAAPPSGTSGCTNEPAGYTTIMNDGFDTSPNGPAWNSGKWSTALVGNQSNIQVVDDATGPKSPGKILRVMYPQGASGGAAPARMGFAPFPANTGKFYMCVFVRLSANWSNGGNTGTKFVFLRSAVETGPQALNHYFNLSPDVAFNLQANGPPSLTRNYNSSASLGGGAWKKLEAVIDGGTTAAAGDGTIKIWVDGTQVVNSSNVKMFFDGQAVAWNLLWLDPTFGGGTNPVPATQWFDIDHWYASVK